MAQKLNEGGKRVNMPQEVIDKFIHSLLLVESPKRRQEIVDEIFEKIKQENIESWLKAHPELKPKETIKENNLMINPTEKEEKVLKYLRETFGEDPEDWDFDSVPDDDFYSDEFEEDEEYDFDDPEIRDLDEDPMDDDEIEAYEEKSEDDFDEEFPDTIYDPIKKVSDWFDNPLNGGAQYGEEDWEDDELDGLDD